MDHNVGRATTPGERIRVASLSCLVGICVTFPPRGRTVSHGSLLPRTYAELARYRLDATLQIRSSYLCRRSEQGGEDALGDEFLRRW
jgi:hypothetical protein